MLAWEDSNGPITASRSEPQSQRKESVDLLDHPVVSLGDLFGLPVIRAVEASSKLIEAGQFVSEMARSMDFFLRGPRIVLGTASRRC